MKTTSLILMSAFCISQTYAYTLPQQPTKSYECDACSKLSHDTLEDKWSISNDSLNDKVSNVQKSYSYKQQVTAKQLQSGVALSILAPGAIIRITPLQKKEMPQLQIKTPENKLMSLKAASSLYSQDDALADTLAASKHQTMLQIKPELGAGTFIIKSKTLDVKDTDTYLINVFDKFSLAHLQIESDSTHYQYGDKLTATINLNGLDGHYSIDDVEASLVDPRGHDTQLELTKIGHNKFEATAILNSEFNDEGENWYIEVNAETEVGEAIIKRSGHTAFSYAIPSASLLSIEKLSSKPLTFVATLDVATASRYALQSVLFREEGVGKIIPIETAQKAQWFNPGKHSIQFTFDNSSQLSDDSLYLGYLHLLDYGQLKPVYQYNKPIKLTQLVE